MIVLMLVVLTLRPLAALVLAPFLGVSGTLWQLEFLDLVSCLLLTVPLVSLDEYRRGVRNSSEILEAQEKYFEGMQRKIELMRDLGFVRAEFLNLHGK